MIQILLILQVVIAIAMIGSVLLQRSDSDGTGLTGGSGGGMGLLSGRQKANALTRTTAILAGLFMINSLALSVLSGHTGSIADRIEAGKALSSEPTSKSTPLPGNKTPDGQPGVLTHAPNVAPTTAAPTQAKPANAPLEAPAAH